jgi:hypothetical protein
MDDNTQWEPSFSLHEFRSWLAKQGQFKMRKKKVKNDVNESMVGKTVEPRLGVKRLEQKIAENNDTKIADILAEQFKTTGGKIVDVAELNVTIEVEGGKFVIPKIYTKDTEA